MNKHSDNAQHTKGELNVNYTADSVQDLAIFCKGLQIATIEPLVNKDEMKANAERIVKAVNMHDELVKALSELVGHVAPYMTQSYYVKQAVKLLKQAEQK